MNSKTLPPPSMRWASIIMDEILAAGIVDLVIAPGSRSTPLVLAAAGRAAFRIFSLPDERGAAFFALGLALGSGRPAAVLCTSGTAAANFHPAVIEAFHAQVPLLVLTADRPPELRGSGANQTIDQLNLYGTAVRFFRDLPAPEADPSPIFLRALRTSVARACAAAAGPIPGPAHLNIPLRKPLEPDSPMPAPRPAPAARPLHIEQPVSATVLPAIDLPSRGLILAGPRCPGRDFPQALMELSRSTGYPVIADGLSGLRFGPWIRESIPLNPQIAHAFLDGALPWPEIVLQFGAAPTARPLLEMLRRLPGDTRRVAVQPYGTWHDEAHTLSHHLHADPAAFCRLLAGEPVAPPVDGGWAGSLRRFESRYWTLVKAAESENFEGLVMADVVEALPDGGALVVANSLPVRHLDEWARCSEKRLRVYCNRGASGIDGTLSTAAGIAAAGCLPLTLVLGDLAFYHDLNGLLALRRFDLPLRIVLIHNDGGGIFHRLPIAEHEPPFKALFQTPLGLEFEPAARMFGLDFQRVENRSEMRAALAEDHGGARIIEVRTDSAAHERVRRSVIAALRKK